MAKSQLEELVNEIKSILSNPYSSNMDWIISIMI